MAYGTAPGDNGRPATQDFPADIVLSPRAAEALALTARRSVKTVRTVRLWKRDTADTRWGEAEVIAGLLSPEGQAAAERSLGQALYDAQCEKRVAIIGFRDRSPRPYDELDGVLIYVHRDHEGRHTRAADLPAGVSEEEAHHRFREAMVAFGNDADRLYSLTVQALDLGFMGLAVSASERLLVIDHNRLRANVLRVLILNKACLHEAAVYRAQLYIKANGPSDVMLVHLAKSYIFMDKFDEAAAAARSAVEMHASAPAGAEAGLMLQEARALVERAEQAKASQSRNHPWDPGHASWDGAMFYADSVLTSLDFDKAVRKETTVDPDFREAAAKVIALGVVTGALSRRSRGESLRAVWTIPDGGWKPAALREAEAIAGREDFPAEGRQAIAEIVQLHTISEKRFGVVMLHVMRALTSHPDGSLRADPHGDER